MSKAIINLTYGSRNLVPNGKNNTMEQIGTSGGVDLSDYECALRILNIPYSFPTFPNASSFSYTWPATSGSGATTYQVAIPANTSWNVSDLNALLQSVMKTNNQFLKNESNEDVFFGSLNVNTQYYRITYTASAIPTALPSGFPASGNPSFPYPLSVSNVLLNIANGDICTTLGFVAGTYPTTSTSQNYNVNGTLAPLITPNSFISVRSNIVFESASTYNDQLHSFAYSGVRYGSVITVEPAILNWKSCVSRRFHSISISLKDQSGEALTVLDPNWGCEILIRPKQT
jgi:hypothetical protein